MTKEEYKTAFPAIKQPLTPEEIYEGKCKGTIVVRPEVSKDGKQRRTTDQRIYNARGPSGGLQRVTKPLTKKAARKLAQKARRQ